MRNYSCTEKKMSKDFSSKKRGWAFRLNWGLVWVAALKQIWRNLFKRVRVISWCEGLELCASKKHACSLRCLPLCKRESEILAGQHERLITSSPGAEQNSSPLLIKASLSHVSWSLSLSADFRQRSDAHTASGFNHRGWLETLWLWQTKSLEIKHMFSSARRTVVSALVWT